jgi:hypothetical protein
MYRSDAAFKGRWGVRGALDDLLFDFFFLDSIRPA